MRILASMNSFPSNDAALSREEFDEFVNVFTHEIRNRLNAIGLEAADLAEQEEGAADIGRLEGRVRDCSAFLKVVRDLLVPDDPEAERLPLAEIIARVRARDLTARD
jgi:signal transduction histidine kinase